MAVVGEKTAILFELKFSREEVLHEKVTSKKTNKVENFGHNVSKLKACEALMQVKEKKYLMGLNSNKPTER